VGGEDKMMDLGTMQYKIDNRDYITMDQVEVRLSVFSRSSLIFWSLQTDLRTLVTAAQIFNPPGTVPHTSATRLLAHGLKHIERARPLVRTPSPSPDPLSSERERSTFSGPEMTAATDDPPFRRTLPDIPPQVYVPEEMLSFPPNSPHASAVGWNLTGGKRVYMRRHIRGREKFAGKWRHWDLDGSRDVAEMDDPAGIFELSRSDHRVGRRITDWKGLRKDAWWDWDGFGGPNGQSPLPFTNFPRLPTLRSRELGQFEWGVYPEIDAEMTYLANRAARADEEQVISEHLRPLRPRHGVQPANFINVYDDPLGRTASDWLRDLFTGDVKGEAYLVSVDRFVSGAVESAKHRTDRGNVKAETNPHGLEEYVRKTWHNGVLHSSPRSTIERTLKSLHKSEIDDTHLLSMARNAYHRLALRNLTSPNNPLDIAPLLTEPHDFLFQGVGGRSGVTLGIDWAAEEVARLNAERASRSGKRPPSPNGPRETRSVKKVKRDPEVQSTGSSPLSAPPDSPSTPSTEAAMRRLRLELVALSKYYPLAALKKMDKADAEKLLPENVRKLMSKAG